jgi:hypothetical protein
MGVPKGDIEGKGEVFVPRIIVTTDPPDLEGPVTLDEQVETIHVSSMHGSRQLLDRVVWAIEDAERVEKEGGRDTSRVAS